MSCFQSWLSLMGVVTSPRLSTNIPQTGMQRPPGSTTELFHTCRLPCHSSSAFKCVGQPETPKTSVPDKTPVLHSRFLSLPLLFSLLVVWCVVQVHVSTAYSLQEEQVLQSLDSSKSNHRTNNLCWSFLFDTEHIFLCVNKLPIILQ